MRREALRPTYGCREEDKWKMGDNLERELEGLSWLWEMKKKG
jgi:hypothetical protein